MKSEHLLECECELQELITHREGMIWENKEREFLREIPCFNQVCFEQTEKKIRELRYKIKGN